MLFKAVYIKHGLHVDKNMQSEYSTPIIHANGERDSIYFHYRFLV